MKKKLLFTILISFSFTFVLLAQNELIASINTFEEVCCENNVDQPKVSNEKMKQIIAEELELLSVYLSKEINYPEVERLYSQEGRVLVRVTFDGEIKAISIVESFTPACDDLVLSKLKIYAKNWDRKEYKDIPKLTFEIPVDFKIRG